MEIIMNGSFQDEKNQHILTHWQNTIEVLRVLQGTMQCLINGRVFTLHKDDICIINRKQMHRIYCEDKEVQFQAVTIDPQVLTGDENVCEKYIDPLISDEMFSHVIIPSDHIAAKEIKDIMENMDDLERSQSDGYELNQIAYLHILFHKLYFVYKAREENTFFSVDRDRLIYSKMSDFIYSNFAEKVSLEDIALFGNISKNKCCQLFKKYAQLSPIDFLNSYRLERSTEYLEQTEETIATIAQLCGFNQQSYYNRLFLRKYGMTPKDYRKSEKREMAHSW